MGTWRVTPAENQRLLTIRLFYHAHKHYTKSIWKCSSPHVQSEDEDSRMGSEGDEDEDDWDVEDDEDSEFSSLEP